MNNTIFRTVQILKYVASRKTGTTLQDICTHFDIPKSSAFVIVQSLLELHFIAVSPFNSKSYSLGVEAFSLGIQYLNDLDIVNQCINAVKPLAERYGKTIFVSALNETQIVFVGKYAAPNALLATCALGSHKEVYATASGKAFLAYLPPQESARIMDLIEFETLTEYTIDTREKLEAELALTRGRGYALERQEDKSISSCCAVPVLDYTGNVVLTISLSDVYDPEIDNEQMSKDLVQVAAEISKNLGYTPH